MNNPEYFTLSELIASDTASALGIGNTPNFFQVGNLHRLCELVLDPVREKLGMPIRVTSGYRSPELNKAVGGVVTSQHVFGCAADITCEDMATLWRLLQRNTKFDQLIKETDSKGALWFHVSVPLTDTAKPRQEVLTITKK